MVDVVEVCCWLLFVCLFVCLLYKVRMDGWMDIREKK